MSKLTAVSEAIESLEKAEEALSDAKRAFFKARKIGDSFLDFIDQTKEYKIIDAIFEGVGDAKETLKHRILAPLEKSAFEANNTVTKRGADNLEN